VILKLICVELVILSGANGWGFGLNLLPIHPKNLTNTLLSV
jgi:hypothetical protein